MLYIILILNLFLVFSLPIANPSLPTDSGNKASLDIISQISEGANNFKASQFEPDLAVESLIGNNNIAPSSKNSTSFAKPINENSRQGDLNDNLINIHLNLGTGGTKTVNNPTIPSAVETYVPPIDTIFDQHLWNEANNEAENPLNSNNINKNDNFFNPTAFKPPQVTSNTLDLSLQLKKLTLPGISAILTPIRPLLVGNDKSSQLILTEASKLTKNLPIAGPILKKLKLDGILSLPGYSEFRDLIDNLIIAGDYYRDEN